MRLLTLALLVGVSLAACRTPQQTLDRGAVLLRTGRAREASDLFGRLSSDRDPRIRIQAYLGAARACNLLADDARQRRWLERAAADTDVPGLIEEVFFELAEILRREGDRSQALNYYYRAAAAAERDHRPEVYRRAILAIQMLSLTP